MKDFKTGRAYNPDVWTTCQQHGFRDLKVSLSEPRLQDKEVRRVGDGLVEWTDACILQPCVPFDTSSPVTVFEAPPRDARTLTTDAASLKHLMMTLAPLTSPRGDDADPNLDPHLLGLEPTVE